MPETIIDVSPEGVITETSISVLSIDDLKNRLDSLRNRNIASQADIERLANDTASTQAEIEKIQALIDKLQS